MNLASPSPDAAKAELRTILRLSSPLPVPFPFQVPLPENSKVLFKFIVDGNWTTKDSSPTETDSSNNLNNVVQVGPAPPTEEEKKQDPASGIKEAADQDLRSEYSSLTLPSPLPLAYLSSHLLMPLSHPTRQHSRTSFRSFTFSCTSSCWNRRCYWRCNGFSNRK